MPLEDEEQLSAVGLWEVTDASSNKGCTDASMQVSNAELDSDDTACECHDALQSHFAAACLAPPLHCASVMQTLPPLHQMCWDADGL